MAGRPGTVRLRQDVVWRIDEEAVILLDTRSSLYMTVAGAGSVLWPLLVTGASPETLVERLVQRYSIDPAIATTDVNAFIDALIAQDLVEDAVP